MALYLLHTTFQGEPVGIWAEDGKHAYQPGIDPNIEKRGAATVHARNELPWSEFVDRRSSASSMRDGWQEINDPGDDLSALLESEREQYHTDENAALPTDQ